MDELNKSKIMNEEKVKELKSITDYRAVVKNGKIEQVIYNPISRDENGHLIIHKDLCFIKLDKLVINNLGNYNVSNYSTEHTSYKLIFDNTGHYVTSIIYNKLSGEFITSPSIDLSDKDNYLVKLILDIKNDLIPENLSFDNNNIIIINLNDICRLFTDQVMGFIIMDNGEIIRNNGLIGMIDTDYDTDLYHDMIDKYGINIINKVILSMISSNQYTESINESIYVWDKYINIDYDKLKSELLNYE